MKKTLTAVMVLCIFISTGTAYAANIVFNDFSDPSTLTLNGSATAVNDVLRLTPAATNQAGSAFLTDSLDLGSSGTFNTYFQFQITDSGGLGNGADGLCFVLQSQGNTALGDGGGGLGYLGLSPSIGIEFDTYWNSGDIDNNHMAININGSINDNSVASYSIPDTLKNNSVWHVWIDYDGTSDLLEIRLADTATMPGTPQLTYSLDLPSILGMTNVFAGFTSGTGGGYGNHDILAWQINSVPVPGAAWLLGTGLLGLTGLRLNKKRKA